MMREYEELGGDMQVDRRDRNIRGSSMLNHIHIIIKSSKTGCNLFVHYS